MPGDRGVSGDGSAPARAPVRAPVLVPRLGLRLWFLRLRPRARLRHAVLLQHLRQQLFLPPDESLKNATDLQYHNSSGVIRSIKERIKEKRSITHQKLEVTHAFVFLKTAAGLPQLTFFSGRFSRTDAFPVQRTDPAGNSSNL